MTPTIKQIDFCLSMDTSRGSCKGDLRTAPQCAGCECFKPESDWFLNEVTKRATEFAEENMGDKA